MVIDGKKLAAELLDELKRKIDGKKLTASVIVVGKNPATESFVRIKRKKAEEIGISLYELRFEDDVKENVLLEAIDKEAEKNSSIIVQLPLPDHINTAKILDSIPVGLDPDVLSKKSNEKFKEGTLDVYPPVVGAIKEILDKGNIDLNGKYVLVIGEGKLVGQPALTWFANTNAGKVESINKNTRHIEKFTEKADVIVSGAGVPGLIDQKMVKDGVILLDAGTSEDKGMLKGDISEDCRHKARIFTPVPGGIGPVTVAKLFENIVRKGL